MNNPPKQDKPIREYPDERITWFIVGFGLANMIWAILHLAGWSMK